MTKQQIERFCSTPEFLAAKKKSDEEFARLVEKAVPVIAATDNSWFLLEFTPEDMEIQGGDPEIAFQCEYGEYVLRVDYSDEIGNSSCWWRKGFESEALQQFEYFAHGIPSRLATEEEVAEYQWAFREAVRSFTRHVILKGQGGVS